MQASLGIDHVYLRVHELDPVLAFFHEQLGLPVSWPARDESFARYAWVNAGNVQLELWQARSNEDLPPGTRLPCVAGLALWPADVARSRELLAASGVACKEPRTWRTSGADGEPAINFTNCLVLDASGPACQVFFCEWDPNAPVVPWPRGETTSARRRRLAAELTACGGGALGLLGLHTVHVESPDPDSTARTWRMLSGRDGFAAPDVRLALSAGPQLRIAALLFAVDDLPRAEAALRKLQMGFEVKAGQLWIDPGRTFGLRLGWTES